MRLGSSAFLLEPGDDGISVLSAGLVVHAVADERIEVLCQEGGDEAGVD
jgi:hypothetical protein